MVCRSWLPSARRENVWSRSSQNFSESNKKKNSRRRKSPLRIFRNRSQKRKRDSVLIQNRKFTFKIGSLVPMKRVLSLSCPYVKNLIGTILNPLLALSSVYLSLCPYQNQLNHACRENKEHKNTTGNFKKQILEKNIRRLFRYIETYMWNRMGFIGPNRDNSKTVSVTSIAIAL